jgi:glycosyltransferase involved in cell wall biosynthesis
LAKAYFQEKPLQSKCSKSILYVWQSQFPWEVRAEKICRALAENGHRVTLFCRASGTQKTPRFSNSTAPELPQHQGFSIWPWQHPVSLPLPGNPFWTQALITAATEVKADLIVARDILVAPMALKAARKLKIPFVIDMAEHYPAALRGWKKYNQSPLSRWMIHDLKLADRIESKVAKFADGIITVCLEQNERLEKLGVRKDRLQTVHNTPELSSFSEVRKGSSDPVRVIAHHGHMTPERGLTNLLQAFHLIKSDHPNLQLHLAGAGESANDIQAQVRALKSENQVHITGAYGFHELPHLISGMDVGILPYPGNDLINHTLSNKIFDYMACDKPVLVSDTKPMRRLIDETGAGFVLNCETPELMAQGLNRFLKMDPAPFSQAGLRAASETYNWQKDCANLVNFLDLIFSLRTK